MTVLLEQAFKKATRELNEVEQDALAQFLLQYNLHHLVKNTIRFISDYNAGTQQAIQDVAERKNINHYSSVNELFAKLGS